MSPSPAPDTYGPYLQGPLIPLGFRTVVDVLLCCRAPYVRRCDLRSMSG